MQAGAAAFGKTNNFRTERRGSDPAATDPRRRAHAGYDGTRELGQGHPGCRCSTLPGGSAIPAQVPPKVSILLPAHQAEATLDVALRSIARQTHRDWECVVVDDGSTDGTLRLARGHAERDGRFVVVSQRHAGIVGALRAGFERCQGRYVARMDADDIMHRERLALQLGVLDSRPELAVVGCHVRLFPRSRLSERMREYEQWLNSIDGPAAVRAEAFVECPLAHPSLMLRREVLAEHPYRDCGWPEDYDLLLRLIEGGVGVGTVPRRLLCWRDAAERLSRTSPSYGIDRFTDCKAFYLARWLGSLGHYVLWGYGRTGRTLGRALAKHGKRPSHIVELHPGRLGQRIMGAPVIAPERLGELEGVRVIASVARAGPRAQVRRALCELGFVEGESFVIAA